MADDGRPTRDAEPGRDGARRQRRVRRARSIGAAVRRLSLLVGVCAGLLVAGGGGGSTALANRDDPAKAEELIRQANEHRRQGHDERALPLLRKAYELARSARTAGQLGLAETALGYWAAAAGHLGEALAEERNPWVEKSRAVLERVLRTAESHLAEIRVDGTPDGAEVVVNGSVAGTLPLASPLKVNEGRVTVEVRAPGRRPMTATLTLVARASQRLTVALEPDAPGPAPPKVTGAPPPPPFPKAETRPIASEAGGAGPLEGPGPSRTEGGGRPTWRGVLAWSLLGGAAVAGAIGVWQQVGSRSARSSFDAIAACGSDLPMRGTDPRCQGHHDDFTSRRTRAYVGYGIAGVLGVGAVTLFILNASSEATPASARAEAGHAAVALGPGSVMFSYAARF